MEPTQKKTKTKNPVKLSKLPGEGLEPTSMRLVHSLFTQLKTHPHREELLTLMDEQLADDTLVLLAQTI